MTQQGATRAQQLTAQRGLARLIGFSVNMGLLAIGSLIMIPALFDAAGTSGWGAIAVGQGVGLIGATVIGYGWGVNGPALIAASEHRPSIFLEALLSRGVIFLPTILTASLLTVAATPHNHLLALVAGLPIMTGGFSGSFYYIGIGSPWAMLLTETIPKVLSMLVAIGFLRAGSGAVTGLLIQLAGVVISIWLSTAYITRGTRIRRVLATAPPVRYVLARQLPMLGATAMGAVFLGYPIIAASVVAPGALPVYGLVDKLQKQLVVATLPINNVLQGWLPGRIVAGVRVRWSVATAISVTATAGLLLTSLLYLLSSPLFSWLSAGSLSVPHITAGLSGLVVALSMISTLLAYACLSPLGRSSEIMISASVGLGVGVAAVPALAFVYGANGVIVGVALGLSAQIVVQMRGVVRALDAARFE